MKLMRLAMCVAVFAVIGGSLYAEDMDIRALQAKLADQEARLNDLQAKMNYSRGGGEAEGVVSIRKNAVVSIGGQVNTRYFAYNGSLTDVNGNKIAKFKGADFKVSDAKINFKIDVNDYFDAFVRINLQNGARATGNWGVNGAGTNDGVSTAQYAWVRWKNVCNSGFGLLVGRSDVVFAAGNQGGAIATGWAGSNDWLTGNPVGSNANGFLGQLVKTEYDHSRTTQVTPYWESQDGKIKAEVSFFSDIDWFDGGRYVATNGIDYRTRNWGLDSMSARLTWKPIEGLRFVGSFMNRKIDYSYGAGYNGRHNNTAINFGADWIPCGFDRLKLFAQWTHNWNNNWEDDNTADVVTAGFWYNLTNELRFIMQGDYFSGRRDNVGGIPGADIDTRGWAVYPALQYRFPYGANIELGYRYEQLKVRRTDQKAKLNTFYAQLGFDF